jgi:DNA-binding LacI/PurR family transcriptional regulator
MSIKKIAERAGVSPSTVSRVLNNPNYRCSDTQMREKIWKIAMELNYTPNEAARNLRTGIVSDSRNTYYINVLMTRTDESQSDPFFTELLHVIESEIHRQLCILAKVWYMPIFSNDKQCRSENLERLIRSMYDEMESPCDGLIIIGKCNRDALKILNKKFKNIVSVNRNSTNYEVDEVICDGKKIASIAVDYLISLGHRNLAYVGQCHNEARYRGFLDVLKKNDIDLEPNYVVETKQTEAQGFAAMQYLLELEDCPTGIYCANDITALGMLKCLAKHKNRYFMPSIISSDDIDAAQYSKPMLTTVRLPKEEMGKFAVYLLMDRICGGHKAVVRTELEGKLIIRDSCTLVENCRWCDYYI